LKPETLAGVYPPIPSAVLIFARRVFRRVLRFFTPALTRAASFFSGRRFAMIYSLVGFPKTW
jgi:hypothetical protein